MATNRIQSFIGVQLFLYFSTAKIFGEKFLLLTTVSILCIILLRKSFDVIHPIGIGIVGSVRVETHFCTNSGSAGAVGVPAVSLVIRVPVRTLVRVELASVPVDYGIRIVRGTFAV